jgi:hypothetical protein
MTLQVILGAQDGVLIATDNKQVTLTSESLKRSDERIALETDSIHIGQYGADKIVFNKAKTIAIACGGWDGAQYVSQGIAEELDSVWGEYVGPIEALVNARWTCIPEAERGESLEFSSNTSLIAVHAEKGEAFKIFFKKESGIIAIFHRRKNQKFVLLGGHIQNPAGTFLEIGYPSGHPRIDDLVFLAAHFILTGERLNPAGIDGLEIHVARNGNPFEEIGEGRLSRIRDASDKFHRKLKRSLVKSLSKFN